jgi:hypothetical protein
MYVNNNVRTYTVAQRIFYLWDMLWISLIITVLHSTLLSPILIDGKWSICGEQKFEKASCSS